MEALGTLEQRCSDFSTRRSSLDIAVRTGLRTLATTPMKGGWRLKTPQAHRTIHDAWLGSTLRRGGSSLLVCCLDATEYQALVVEHRRLLGAGST